MFAKVLLVAFLAVFALQAPADAASIVPTRAEMKSIVDDVLNILQQMWDFSKQQLGDLFNTVIQLGQEAIEAGKKNLEELIGYFKQEVATLVEEAQAVGADVTECVQGVEENVNDLYNKAIAEVQDCLEHSREEVEDLIKEAHVKLEVVFAEIEELKQKFLDCDGDWFCIADVVNEAINAAESFPGQVNPILQEAKQVAHDIIAEVPSCVAGKTTDLKEDLDVILSTVTECIKDKLPTPQ